MIEFRLNMGDLVTTDRRDVMFTCLGLGSCIGLFLQDRTARVSGGAHILLPTAEPSGFSNQAFFDASSAVMELLRQFRAMGSTLKNVRAKMAGGAHVVDIKKNVGAQNLLSVQQLLIQQNIFIAAMDVGGVHCRSVRFQSASGDMHVRVPHTNEVRTL